ncbi:MAG: hypothetical protein I8H86_05905 [Sphingomonadaceae bacterium]|nr:hypothetical protein [Sphingomonadaceae bacterium]MBH1997721.1 hypothetical protein [Sphingomonadaceae bacterium]
MAELIYARYRDYRGYLIECIDTPLRRQRFAVWKDRRRLGVFRENIIAERFIERVVEN